MLISIGLPASAQQLGQDTSRQQDDKIIVDHADIGEYIQENDREIQRLLKVDQQVELRQGQTFMYCDTAVLEANHVVARGNILIQQGDTLSLYADSLIYQGNTQIADLFGEVVLVNKTQKLFTNLLKYNLNTKVATYRTGALLTNDTTHLTSKVGYYYVNTNEAYFKDSVIVQDPQFILRSDTLKYNTDERIAYFLGPTLIEQEETRIFCTGGFYDTRSKLAEFTGDPQYEKASQRATANVIRYDGNLKEVTLAGDAVFRDSSTLAVADVIRYEEETEVTWLEGNAHFEDDKQVIDSQRIRYDSKNEAFNTSGRARISDPPQILEADNIEYVGQLGVATGQVIWQDTAEQITIACERADYNKETDFLLATGARPLLTTLIDRDTMRMRSDTLISMQEMPEDSIRTLIAFRDVRILKSNLQAVCDSLSYSYRDSLFRFYYDPVIWSDTSQFSADTVRMQLANDQIDRIYLYKKSLIVNTTDEVLFNQIKGRDMIAYFDSSELRRMLVEGNAESIYYAQDESNAYIGVNKTVCSKMMLHFGNNKVEDIYFYAQPQGSFLPIGRAKQEELKLEGFRWEVERRPLQLDDL